MLLSKSKTDKLSSITNVNLWGNDLEDLSIIAQELPNVEIVSLSLNRITTLKDFQGCTKLKELFLRKNNIADLNEVQYLTKLPKLQTLWLSNNPCADHPYYRLYVIRMLPGLLKLDNSDITQEERNQARNMNMDAIMMQKEFHRKPSQVSVLQQIQNNSMQQQQQQQLVTSVSSTSSTSQQQQQAKSPFKNDQQIKKLIADQQQQKQTVQVSQSQSPMMQQHQQSHQMTPSQQQPQPSVLKKVNRPGSALGNQPLVSSSSSNQNSVQKTPQVQQSVVQQTAQEQRSENILCAVLALLKELGESELELVKRDIDKKLIVLKTPPQHSR